VRLVGFASTVFGVNFPLALTWQYLAVGGALGFGFYAISRGLIIEPPALLFNTVNATIDWFTRRAGAVLRPTQ
jgi:lipopolysaccharide export system permease protein